MEPNQIPLPPTGTELNCKGWHQEAALRCLLNNLHPDVAEDRDSLIVYGGNGKAARNPKALADKVYGHRGGNDGQGYAWRGRGFLQLTHRDNYRAFASDMRLPEVMDNPDLVANDYAMDSAMWFFKRNNIWKICDEGVNDDTIKRVTRVVNGGYNGLDHRVKETKKIYGWLK